MQTDDLMIGTPERYHCATIGASRDSRHFIHTYCTATHRMQRRTYPGSLTLHRTCWRATSFSHKEDHRSHTTALDIVAEVNNWFSRFIFENTASSLVWFYVFDWDPALCELLNFSAIRLKRTLFYRNVEISHLASRLPRASFAKPREPFLVSKTESCSKNRIRDFPNS